MIDATLFWVEADASCDASAIRRLPSGSSVPEDVLSLPGPDQIADVTIEEAAGRAFFTFGQSSANSVETVERVNLDGSGRLAIKTYGISPPSPLGIVVDSGTDTVYWLTNGGCGPCPACGPCSTLESSRLDGTANTTVHTITGMANVRMVALDAQNRKVYFSDLQFTPQIQRINVDGSGLEPVLDSTNEGTDDIELDVAGGKIYWLDSSSIRRANLDGTGAEPLTAVNTTPRGLAVDPVGGKIYWTESGFCGTGATGQILRANLDGSSVELVLDNLGILLSIEVSR